MTVDQMRVLLGLGPDVPDAEVVALYAEYLAGQPSRYVVPTPADIRLDFAVFATVGDEVIQRRIDRTAATVDESWMVADYTYARALLTAHFLTEDGIGGSSDAEISALRDAGVSTFKSGALSVSFASDTDNGAAGSWESTAYGRRFMGLLRRNKGGMLTTGGVDGGIAGAATDVSTLR